MEDDKKEFNRKIDEKSMILVFVFAISMLTLMYMVSLKAQAQNEAREVKTDDIVDVDVKEAIDNLDLNYTYPTPTVETKVRPKVTLNPTPTEEPKHVVKMTVIYDKTRKACDPSNVIKFMQSQYFEYMDVTKLHIDEEYARELMRKYNVTKYNVYILDGSIKYHSGYHSIQNAIIPKDNVYIIKPEAIGYCGVLK